MTVLGFPSVNKIPKFGYEILVQIYLSFTINLFWAKISFDFSVLAMQLKSKGSPLVCLNLPLKGSPGVNIDILEGIG